MAGVEERMLRWRPGAPRRVGICGTFLIPWPARPTI